MTRVAFDEAVGTAGSGNAATFIMMTNLDPPHVILVGTDFSDDSARAVHEAWTLATQRRDGQLHLVHVLDERPALLSQEEALVRNERLMEGVPDQLRNHAIGIAQKGQLPPLHRAMGFHVRLGEPSEAILQLAVDIDAALVVVGSHGKSGWRKLLGSTSSKLVSAARVPVLVAHARDYASMAKTETLDPPCTDCLAVRHASGGGTWWCDLHDREGMNRQGFSHTDDVHFTKNPQDFEGAMAGGTR